MLVWKGLREKDWGKEEGGRDEKREEGGVKGEEGK